MGNGIGLQYCKVLIESLPKAICSHYPCRADNPFFCLPMLLRLAVLTPSRLHGRPLLLSRG
ncbi:hypothetical protein [Arsenophonus sp. ENCA]|uniref:hypothetical protein n=1 Tax=Arsenophonus sp. ENCA TaxID=1987579 RepID=UPI0025B8BBAB|nr:hypothetical protein [Arsenophonus sp. ENCA]